jgi:hypothetical protein
MADGDVRTKSPGDEEDGTDFGNGDAVVGMDTEEDVIYSDNSE